MRTQPTSVGTCYSEPGGTRLGREPGPCRWRCLPQSLQRRSQTCGRKQSLSRGEWGGGTFVSFSGVEGQWPLSLGLWMWELGPGFQSPRDQGPVPSPGLGQVCVCVGGEGTGGEAVGVRRARWRQGRTEEAAGDQSWTRILTQGPLA